MKKEEKSEGGTKRMGETKNRSDLFKAKVTRIAAYALFILVVAYVIQFVWLAMESKGQTRADYAWELLGYETLSQQYHDIPQMRVTYGKPSHWRCNVWNFEALRGGCMTVKIGLDVRDYRPEYRPIVEREVKRLADQMRTPCRLLPTLGFENQEKLAKDLGCNGMRTHFRLHFWVNEVTVTNEQGPADYPNRWSLNTVKHIYTTDFIEGEL